MIFVVVPAYNEEKQIGRVVRGLFEHGFGRVVVVDDGSVDATSLVAREAGATVLKHEINRGQGAALQTGNEWALSIGAEMIIHFDGDGQFTPKDIAVAIAVLKNSGADIVFGSRFLENKSKIPFLKKYFVLPIARVINNFLTGIKLSDAHNGFRAMTRAAAEKILITQDGMAHNTEIVWQVKRHGLKWVECPVEVKYLEYGQGMGGGIKVISDWLFSKFV